MYGYSMQNNMVAVQQQPYQPQMVQPQIVSLATPAQPMVKPLISPVNTQQPAVGQVWGQPANQVMVANVAAPFTNTVNVELSLKVPKSYYFAGEVIEGVAVVSSNVQTNAQVLQINLNGVMVRSVMTPHFRDEGTRNIFQRRVEVPLQGGLIPAGQVLTLPFKIQTPDRYAEIKP